ncbi:adhesion G-protein coupled receptor G5-like [Sander lucioperca]|uniref:adhesion G-protein coupled receptor G5-like n=1 Tax=Sander lucioperca TaxID=283035 RepID=UPI00125CD671|nr:adhesion G-protein coupled receptor G5-like [Sander lucioperca]XP_035855694.1 adhesion G-protein coupled receptor G5-like [Sander lucioperca]
MVPLLLSMLLSTSLADQVCLNISDGNMTITMNNTNILDEAPGYVRCLKDTFPCLFQCTCNETLDIHCFDANVTIHDTWVDYSMTQKTSCSVYLCKNSTILPMIHSLASQDSEAGIMKLFYIRDSCQDLFSSDHEVKTAFISVERKMIHNIMGTSQIETGGSINYEMKGLSLNVLNFSEAELTNSEIKIEAPQLLPQNTSFIPDIWLPADALHTIPKEKRIIGLVSYMQHSQFKFKQEEISSMVLRIEVLDEHGLQDLETPIKMTFRAALHTAMDNDSWLQCHYLDERDWVWKTDGCETTATQTRITCNCNHATPFAVLLMRGPISEIHWQILSNISYIGCGLSAFFTALSLVIYVFGRNQKMDYSISIHVSLSGALLLLNTTFLLTEWGATVEPAWVCVFVAALMHYSLLCCFTWMAIEALHLYLLLIKVFNTYFKHYMVKLSLAGWGIPGVIVAVSVGMKDFKQFYGLTEMTMADTNQTNAICWITDDSYFYSLNLVYFTLIFIFNSGILLVVASNICKMKQVFRSTSKLRAEAQGKPLRDSEKFDNSCRSGLTVMGLTCLMGTTWGLAFLGSGYINYPILYLFCILNSAQGFFIFLWICLSAKKQRKRHMEDRLSSTPVKTSAVKFD